LFHYNKFRVNYEKNYYQLLSKAIIKNQLSSIDRLGIQNGNKKFKLDLSALSEAVLFF
jgi:hypothetical protein